MFKNVRTAFYFLGSFYNLDSRMTHSVHRNPPIGSLISKPQCLNDCRMNISWHYPEHMPRHSPWTNHPRLKKLLNKDTTQHISAARPANHKRNPSPVEECRIEEEANRYHTVQTGPWNTWVFWTGDCGNKYLMYGIICGCK